MLRVISWSGMMIATNNLKSSLKLAELENPDEDFEPMPEGDKQRRNLSYTTEALRLWFESQQNVYVSGNLFIRYKDQNIEKRIAPDTFVVFGMNNEDRVSYKIWEKGNKAPDFVLEVTSKGTITKDREQNPLIYQNLGVKEYFQYDPTGEYLQPTSLQGVRLEQGNYIEIPIVNLPDGVLSLHSEVLGLDLHLYSDKGFRFYDPISNQILRSLAEAEQGRLQAELERSLERQFRIQAEQEKIQAMQEQLKAKQEQSKAEAISQQQRIIAQQERQQKEKLAAYLRSLGINPDEI
jgi:Uma2 family endonuclease